MAFQASLTKGRSRIIFLVFFSLAALFPLFIAAFIVSYYLLPLLTPTQWEELSQVLLLGLVGITVIHALSFLLMYQWIKALENVTNEIVSASTLIARRQKGFDNEVIACKNSYVGSVDGPPEDAEGNEIQSLIRSFNTIFLSASDQIEERNRLKELLARLIGVATDLTSELDFDRLFPLIISNVTEVMQAERTSLYVVDWDRRELWTSVAEGIEKFRIPFGQGISGRVAETGRMMNIADAWELPYFDRSFDEKNRFRTKSVLCIPVKSHESEIIGVLQVINKKGKDQFDEEDEAFLRGLSTQVSIALENSLLVEEVLATFSHSISTLSAMVDARHRFTGGHSQRVMEISLAIARHMKMGKEEMEVLKYAALLHDIGKVGIRDDVLLKNGSFTPEDWDEMKTHTSKTKSILDQFHFRRHLKRIPAVAAGHHEKMDGRGYHLGLAGNVIPLETRIIAVADMFDAVTSKRDYPKYTGEETFSHDPMPLPRVIMLLKNLAGREYDADVVDALLCCLPAILVGYRGVHYDPAYVDETIEALTR